MALDTEIVQLNFFSVFLARCTMVITRTFVAARDDLFVSFGDSHTWIISTGNHSLGFVHIEALLLLMTFKTFIDILVFNRLFAVAVGA